MSFRYLYSPAEITAALRTVAARLDTLPEDTQIPETFVSLDIQITRYGGDGATRMAAVDALVSALLPDLVAVAEEHEDTGERTYRIPHAHARAIDGLIVNLYAPDVPAPAALAPAA
jgi:hypothetical protein